MKSFTIYSDKEGVLRACVEPVPMPAPELMKAEQPPDSQAYFDRAFNIRMKAYREALQRCKDSSVPFAEQSHAMRFIYKGFQPPKPDTFYPINEVDVTIEMRNPCLFKGDCQSPGENGWTCLHECKLRHLVARIIAPSVTNPVESQEELWREVDKVFNVKWTYGVVPDDVMNELKEKFTITRK